MTEKEYQAIRANGRTEYTPEFYKSLDADHEAAATAYADVLIDVFSPRSVVEFGCGTGATLSRLSDRGVSVQAVEGYETARPFIRRRNEWIADHMLVMDLNEPATLPGGPYDLALCIEVLEHLRPDAAHVAIDSLLSASSCVVATACPPTPRTAARRSAGEVVLHLNEQPWGYWQELFRQAGAVEDADATERLRRAARGLDIKVPAWYTSHYIGVFRTVGE